MHTPDEDPAAVVDFPQDPEGAVDRVVRKTPWWALSLGLHAAAALVIGFFWIVQADVPVEATVVKPPRTPREIPKFEPPQLKPKEHLLDRPKEADVTAFVKDPTDAVNESEDDDFAHKAKGDPDEICTKPFKGRGIYDVVGGGGGGGGRLGSRDEGGKVLRLADGGGGGKTEDAVLNALKWLSRHQNPDGSWSVAGYVARCKETCSPNPGHEEFDAGVTGLSMLAFLGAGYSHLSKDTHDGLCFGDVVRKGLQWMMAHQDPEGCVGARSGGRHLYNHAIGALTLAEAYGLTGSPLFRDPAQRAIDFLAAAQNPGRGWRYSCRSGDNDTSVTGWAVMAFKSAELSGLSLPPGGYDGARAWLDHATEPHYGRVGYTGPGTGKVYTEANRHFDHHEALSAIGVMSRIFMDKNPRDPLLASGCSLLLADKPRFEGNATDFYYWYYASLALFQFDGPKGPKWRSWNEPLKDALVPTQNAPSKGCRRGSWEPVDRWSCEGGRVYATAINALTLEVYYRYANVFGRQSD